MQICLKPVSSKNKQTHIFNPQFSHRAIHFLFKGVLVLHCRMAVLDTHILYGLLLIALIHKAAALTPGQTCTPGM